MLLPMVASADAVEIKGIYYNLITNTKTAEVTSNPNKYTGSIVIPETFNYNNVTYSVTSIGDNAFLYCYDLTSVTIPNSVTSIGDDAFKDCSGLKKVIVSDIAAWCGISFDNYYSNPLNSAHRIYSDENTEIKNLVIPNSVTSISNYAFYGCSSLTSLTIPNSVTSIGNSAFYGCVKLATIYCLNPTPPTCYNSSTFAGSSSSLHNQYDVYTYATLHVPMGSEELYSSAYEWRYFNKIKEDMESNGQVYYANLTVRQGTTGYTRQPVKAAETYTIYIGSLGDNKVNAVIFNGVDVTDYVVNGYYTTPEIKGESVLSVTYESNASALSAPEMDNLKVMGYHGEICVDNIDRASCVTVYSVDGKLIDSIPSAIGSARLQVPTDQLYIVKVENRTFKLAM